MRLPLLCVICVSRAAAAPVQLGLAAILVASASALAAFPNFEAPRISADASGDQQDVMPDDQEDIGLLSFQEQQRRFKMRAFEANPHNGGMNSLPAKPKLVRNSSAHGDRYLFIAGSPATGHHFLGKVFSECVMKDKCRTRGKNFNYAIWDFRYVYPMINKAWKEDWEKDHSKLIPMNTHGGMMLSYPVSAVKGFRTGPNLSPQLAYLNTAAKQNGDDLKVLVLLRDPRIIVKEAEEMYEQTEEHLTKGMRQLIMHLSTIPKAKIRCLHFSALTATADAIMDELHVKNFNSAQELMKSHPHHQHCTDLNPCPDAPGLAAVQDKLASKFCHTLVGHPLHESYDDLRPGQANSLYPRSVELAKWLLDPNQ